MLKAVPNECLIYRMLSDFLSEKRAGRTNNHGGERGKAFSGFEQCVLQTNILSVLTNSKPTYMQ